MGTNTHTFLKQVVTFAACFLAFLLIWIVAVPFVKNYYRKIHKLLRYGLIILMSALLIVLKTPFTLWFILLPIFVLEAHLYVGLPWIKSTPLSQQLKSTIKLLLFALGHISVAVVLRHFTAEMWSTEVTLWIEKVIQYIQANPVAAEALNEQGPILIQYIFGFYFSAFSVAYLLTFWSTWFLSKIELPALFFWGILLSFTLAFLDFQGLKLELPPQLVLIAKNVFFPLCCLYFFQGVAVLNSLFDKVKIARFWRNIWYVFIILYLPLGLVLVGVTDFLFEYREKHKEKRKDIK